MVIAELGKRVEKYNLINNLAQAQAAITFGHIARGDIDFPRNEFQRILSGKMGGAKVNFAGKDEVHGVSMSRHLLVRVEVYSESTMALFDSGAIANIMSHKIVKKLHLRMQPMNRGHIERGSDKLGTASSTYRFPGTRGNPVRYPYRLANYDSASCSLGILPDGTQDLLRRRLRNFKL